MKPQAELMKMAKSTNKMTQEKYLHATSLREKLAGLKNPAAVNAAMVTITRRYVEETATPIVICLTGAKGAGKSTVSAWFEERFKAYGYTASVLPIAKPLKDLATSMGWDGEKDEKGRRLLQLLGTECGRDCISESIWTDKWLAEAVNLGSKVIIVDDCRYDNEYRVVADYAERAGATFYHVNVYGRNDGEVTNPSFWSRFLPKKKVHQSEQGISHKADVGIDTSNSHIPYSQALLEDILNAN